MRSKLLLGLICLTTGGVSWAADLKVVAEPAFVGLSQTSGVYPVAVTVRNTGPDARGALRVTSEKFQMDYPIELPKGAVKRIVTYPEITYGSEVQFQLSTDQGDARTAFRQFLGATPNTQNALLIGETQGDLGFLRGRQDTASRLVDTYVKPENAPDRPIAYVSFAVVVLGAGAERISDGAVRALHLFAMSGGTVLFLGGASSPTLADRRWADIVPVHAKLPKTIASSRYLAKIDPTPLRSDFTIPEADPVGDPTVVREGSDILIAKRGVGLGKTLYYAFNPLEAPFTRWPGRRLLFERTIKPQETLRAAGYLRGFLGERDESQYGPRSWRFTSGGRVITYAGDEEPRAADPFSTKLPEPQTVFIILSLYFVTIIPLNFLLLKKLKKGELAWFTAPLISVAFAGAFFAEAKDLYSAKLSKATQGLIVQAGTNGDSLFVGHSQMFFPRGGEYNLDVAGLEYVGSSRTQNEDMYGMYNEPDDPGLEEVNAVDTGHVTIPRMSVGNLSFRQLAFQQVLPLGQWFDAKLNAHVLTVRNVGRSRVDNVAAVVAGQTFPVKSLEPGESARITLPEQISPDSNMAEIQTRYYADADTSFNNLSEITSGTKEIVIKGSLQEAPVGPRLGDVVRARQQIYIAYFSGIHYGDSAL